jgi:beta-glucosidase
VVVVVVNAGMPVLMPWADRVAAVLYAWLPGQAMGDALADVLLGRAEPGGRLPVTMPAREADCPVLRAVPGDGRLAYDEGLLVGYRGYDAAGTTPLFPFGHGLGYTSWSYESLAARPPVLAAGDDLTIGVTVRNTGERPCREVVQAYVAGPAADGRPVRVLGAFGPAAAGPGEAAQVTLTVPARVFARYDEQAARWVWPSGGCGRPASSRSPSAGPRVTSGCTPWWRWPDRPGPWTAAGSGGPGGPHDRGGTRPVPPRSASPGQPVPVSQPGPPVPVS